MPNREKLLAKQSIISLHMRVLVDTKNKKIKNCNNATLTAYFYGIIVTGRRGGSWDT
jgi:hypothetical protein